MTMTGDLAPRDQTPSEVIAMIKTELAERQIGSGASIHIHYHAGTPSAPSPAPVHDHAQDRRDKIKEYIVIAILGEIALGSLAAVALLLVPTIMAVTTMLTTFMIGFAVSVVALAAAIRSLRQTGTDRQIMSQRLKATGRRR